MPISPTIIIIYVPAIVLLYVCHVTTLELGVNVMKAVVAPTTVGVTVI